MQDPKKHLFFPAKTDIMQTGEGSKWLKSDYTFDMQHMRFHTTAGPVKTENSFLAFFRKNKKLIDEVSTRQKHVFFTKKTHKIYFFRPKKSPK